jgi:hypothetical protein
MQQSAVQDIRKSLWKCLINPVPETLFSNKHGIRGFFPSENFKQHNSIAENIAPA